MSVIVVLYDGYSVMKNDQEMSANCSCTLIRSGNINIIVDTMTPWDTDKIKSALRTQEVNEDDINYVVSTHGHSDHTGNNNLFLKAKHIVGFCISYKDSYSIHPFDKGEEYIINEYVKVVPTPGHTLTDITVFVVTTEKEIVAVAGDLFEKYEDVDDPSIWLEAGSEDPIQQKKNRSKVAQLADWIIPGHGPKFKVTNQIRKSLLDQVVI